MKFLKEFKEFAVKGNMIDMAVGIIIGGAFGKIISSLVNDVLMPPLGYLIGGVDFSNLAFVIKAAVVNNAGEIVNPAITLNYGTFIQTIIDFLLIALSIFFVIKAMNKAKKKEDEVVEEVAPEVPTPSAEESLLTEIRDLLKNKQ